MDNNKIFEKTKMKKFSQTEENFIQQVDQMEME